MARLTKVGALLLILILVVLAAVGFKGNTPTVSTVLISGTLVDGHGNPVPNAAIIVYPDVVGSENATGSSTTDSDGNYSVSVPNSTVLTALAAADGVTTTSI